MELSNLRSLYAEAILDATDWFTEGREIVKFILPKHGRLDKGMNTMQKKTFSSRYIVNPVAGDAFNILTSGMHGRLTGQNRQWCRLSYSSPQGAANDYLNVWLSDCQKRLHTAWQKSNFYEVMPVYYKEIAGFGTGSLHVGESDTRFFNFDLLTYGEFVFTMGDDGKIDAFFRHIDLTLRQLELIYGKQNLPAAMRESVTQKQYNLTRHRVIQCVYREKFRDKPITSVHYLESGGDFTRDGKEKPLRVSGYYEWPLPTARWEAIGSDTMGCGLGSDILPFVKRLQEMTKYFIVATHKAVEPPYNVPARLRGKVQTVPGGLNYVANVNEKVEPILNPGFEYRGVLDATRAVEDAIRKMCYNDVFITGMRDPNASPLKARQVDMIEDEGVIRLGPVIGRLYSEALTLIVERCFNSMLRRNLFLPVDPEMLRQAGGIDITLIGPLAQQQKLIEVRSIQSFFQFLAAATPFDETAKDNVNTDRTILEVADMTGVPAIILNTPEEKQQIRQQRAAMMQRQQKMQEEVALREAGGQAALTQAQTAESYANAGVNVADIMGGGM